MELHGGLDILGSTRNKGTTMPLFAAAAKHLHARRTTLRAVALCTGMVLAQAVSAAPAALRVGDQSGLVQTLLQAAGRPSP